VPPVTSRFHGRGFCSPLATIPAIIKLADGPGDRWSRAIGAGGKSGHRRRRLARAGDEDLGLRARVTPQPLSSGWGQPLVSLVGGATPRPPSEARGKRATRLVTPGDGHAGSAAKRSYTPKLNPWTGGVELSSARCGSVTESATENIPPAAQHGGIAQGNLRDVFEKKLNRLARVKRWGKSPPSR
jgi:hypothetical protein